MILVTAISTFDTTDSAGQLCRGRVGGNERDNEYSDWKDDTIVVVPFLHFAFLLAGGTTISDRKSLVVVLVAGFQLWSSAAKRQQ